MIKYIASRLGIDKAISYFLIGKGFSFIAAPLTLYFIAHFLSPIEQGYYYTFYSLLGMSIFFELGLGVVITQFVSHEFANLSWDGTSLKGNEENLSRVISIIRKSVKWYGIIAGLLVACILPGGLILLGSKPESSHISYLLPWIGLVVFFGLNTSFIPVLSVLEGCGKVAQVQQLRLIQAILGVTMSWVVFLNGGKLLAVTMEFAVYFSVIIIWFVIGYNGLFKQIYQFDILHNAKISWFKEIFPMQWKIAVSWIAAYFTGYLFVPLLFAYRDPVEAGKMGMSLKIATMVYTLGMAWINTKIPYYGAMISQNKYKDVEEYAKKNTINAVTVSVILSVCAVIGLIVLEMYVPKYYNRVLPKSILFILCLTNVAGVAMAGIAGYLRAHKEEPLMPVSVGIAVVVAIMSYVTARYYDANVMSVSYAAITICAGIPAFWYILTQKRKQWYEQL